MSYTKEQIEKAVKAKGYAWFENGDYDVNIVSVRTSSTGKAVTNLFDDYITISFKKDGVWQFYQWMATTDPGKKAVLEYHNPNGVARLVPGQYRGSHIVRLHQGKYRALCQDKPVKVYRDKNKDFQFDEKTIEEGIFGINMHRSNPTTESAYVENWSEGCAVFKKVKDFNQFMTILDEAIKIHGNRFTLTLLESKDLA